MLFIESIKVTDMGRHKKVESVIEGYSPGLVGSNGRGKTTIIQALQFAITGTIETEPSEPLRNFIRRTSGDNPPKGFEVDVHFRADGRKGRIWRRVTRTTSTRKFWWDGEEKPITAEKAINSIMSDILGVDKKAINSTVFIRQGETDSMFGGDNDRRDFYTRLMMQGHLAKVASTIDSHRSNLASSVQDLGAVRDAADQAAEEAVNYFTGVEAEIKVLTDNTDSLKIARAFKGLFVAAEDSSETKSNCHKKLVGVLPPDTEPQPYLDSLEKEIIGAKAEVKEFRDRKSSHMRLTSLLREQEESLRTSKAAEALWVKHDKLVADHEALKDKSLESKADGIAATEGLLRDFAEFTKLRSEEPGLKESLTLARQVEADLDVQLEPLESSLEDYKEAYQKRNAELEMSRRIKAGLSAAHVEQQGKPCPACGSDNPNLDYLDRVIEEGEAEVAALATDGKAAREKYNKVREALSAANKSTSSWSGAVDRAVDRRKRLQISLASKSEEGLTTELTTLKEQHAQYLTHAQAMDQATNAIAAVQLELQPYGTTRYPAEMIAQYEKDLEATRVELAAFPWATDDQVREAAAADKYNSAITKKEQVARYAVELESAQTTQEAAEKALDEAWSGEAMKSLNTGWSQISLENAETLVNKLEEEQTLYDAAQGRLDAAKDRMKAANRKVSELALRTEEQQTRLKLVDDLERLRDTFKPNGATLEFLNYKFGQIATLAADYLAESGADFMVAPSEEIPLSFDFLRTDREGEVWLPQNRLSGGQKVRLAVATLRAIHAMVMPNVGLLVLDEPTTHLDETAKESMADMLRQIASEETLQIVICDHSPTLIEAFSDIIEITE